MSMSHGDGYFVPTKLARLASWQEEAQPAVQVADHNITHIRVTNGKCTEPKCGAEGPELLKICGRLRTKK